MEKEEILAKSRSENQNKDLVELSVMSKAYKWAYSVAGLLCCTINLLECIYNGMANTASLMILTGLQAAYSLYCYVHLKRWYDLVLGVLLACGVIVLMYFYIYDLQGIK